MGRPSLVDRLRMAFAKALPLKIKILAFVLIAEGEPEILQDYCRWKLDQMTDRVCGDSDQQATSDPAFWPKVGHRDHPRRYIYEGEQA